MKYISIKEFRDLGYIHEINRLFLHPLGLALEVIIDDDGTHSLGGVQDHREDLDGMIYEKVDVAKVESITNIVASRHMARVSALGFWHQPVPNE